MNIEKQDDGKVIFNIVRNRMFSALNSFYIWKKINQSINVNEESGPKLAQENVDQIINKYPNFFQQVLISSYKTFVADLAIFFDSEKHEDSLSIGKLFELLQEKNVDLLVLKEEIGIIKKPHGRIISLIMELRNQDVAHQAMDPQQHVLNYQEVENLFKAVQEVLNKITRYYDDSITVWDHIEESVNGDVQWIYGNLKRGEKVRLDEIRVKWSRNE